MEENYFEEAPIAQLLFKGILILVASLKKTHTNFFKLKKNNSAIFCIIDQSHRYYLTQR